MTDKAVREYLSKLGRRGAAATNSKLTKKERQESARRAAQARWAKIDSGLKEMAENLAKLQDKAKARKSAREKAKE